MEFLVVALGGQRQALLHGRVTTPQGIRPPALLPSQGRAQTLQSENYGRFWAVFDAEGVLVCVTVYLL